MSTNKKQIANAYQLMAFFRTLQHRSKRGATLEHLEQKINEYCNKYYVNERRKKRWLSYVKLIKSEPYNLF